MSAINRLHGRTPVQRYLCCHVFHGGGGYGNSIFNTTYNFNGGVMCGGGFWGGVLGGLGMGLGSIFGGSIFAMGGMFGGGMFGMGNMFGMGGYSPLAGLFGGGRSRTDGAGGKDNAKDNSKEKVVTKYNKDTKPIGNYSAEIDKMRDDNNKITKKKLIALYDKITKSKNEQDDIEKDADTKTYDNLLKDLKVLAAEHGLEEKDGKLVDKTPQNNNKDKPVSGNNGNENGNDNSKNVNDSDKTDPVNITHPVDNNGNAQNAKITTLNCAKHERNGMRDTTISGILAGIKHDSKGRVEYYVIKCKDKNGNRITGNTYGLTYKITPKYEGDSEKAIAFNVKCISKNHNATHTVNGQEKAYNLFRNKDGLDYTLNEETQKLEYVGDDTTVAESNKGRPSDYIKIEYKPNEREEYTEEFEKIDENKYDVTYENGTIKVKNKEEEQQTQQQ